MAAMMTYKRAAKTMFYQPSVAILTTKSMTANATKRQWRVAASIEKKQRLFLTRKSFTNGEGKLWRDPFAFIWTFTAHVDGVKLRQGTRTDARL